MPDKYHAPLYTFFFRNFRRQYKKSYSQSGEDMILDNILGSPRTGFYVDVGANNPVVQSNTKYFYQKGWRGINIDALPGSMKKFKLARPRDINLETPVSDEEKIINYYMFQPSFYNSFLEEQAVKYKDKLVGKRELRPRRLDSVLNQYTEGAEIDFMSVDVEGMDLKVLKSNDWTKYRPKVLILEIFAEERESGEARAINDFLAEKNYFPYCGSPKNTFYLENSFFRAIYNQGKTGN